MASSPDRPSRPRRSPPPTTRRVPQRLSNRDRQLLGALARFGHLTAIQLCLLVFRRPGSLSYCRDRLRRLASARLVGTVYLHRARYGSALTVYTDVRPHRRTTNSTSFLGHTLAVTDLLLAIRALTDGDRRRVTRLDLERELRRAPLIVRVDGSDAVLIPDAYLQLVIAHTYELGWCLELDRGTQSPRAFRAKVARYLAAAAGPYQAAFRTTALTVVIVTTAGARRLAHLIGATEDELEARGRIDDADLFRLTSADPEHEPATDLFGTARWWIPFHPDPVPLVPEAAR